MSFRLSLGEIKLRSISFNRVPFGQILIYGKQSSLPYRGVVGLATSMRVRLQLHLSIYSIRAVRKETRLFVFSRLIHLTLTVYLFIVL